VIGDRAASRAVPDVSFARRALAALTAALVWPLPTPFGSVVDYDLAADPPPADPRLRPLYEGALAAFPALFLAFAALLVVEPSLYARTLAEDALVEWATVAGLVAAAGVAAATASAEPGWSMARWIYVALTVVCLAVALEEISWGQRIFGIENPEFFVKYSDQKEINVHNVLQKVTHVAMKWPVGLGFVAYGVLLPIGVAAAGGRGAGGADRALLAVSAGAAIVPPLALVRGFLLGAILMLDLPTNDEEELAELFGVLALLVLLARAAFRRPSAVV
jgi:FtsH-binding integral membrane protein